MSARSFQTIGKHRTRKAGRKVQLRSIKEYYLPLTTLPSANSFQGNRGYRRRAPRAWGNRGVVEAHFFRFSKQSFHRRPQILKAERFRIRLIKWRLYRLHLLLVIYLSNVLKGNPLREICSSDRRSIYLWWTIIIIPRPLVRKWLYWNKRGLSFSSRVSSVVPAGVLCGNQSYIKTNCSQTLARSIPVCIDIHALLRNVIRLPMWTWHPTSLKIKKINVVCTSFVFVYTVRYFVCTSKNKKIPGG